MTVASIQPKVKAPERTEHLKLATGGTAAPRVTAVNPTAIRVAATAPQPVDPPFNGLSEDAIVQLYVLWGAGAILLFIDLLESS